MNISLKTFTLMLITEFKKKPCVASVNEATQGVITGQFAPLTQIPHKEETPAVLPQRHYSELLYLAVSLISSSFSTTVNALTTELVLVSSALSAQIFMQIIWPGFWDSGGKIFGTS